MLTASKPGSPQNHGFIFHHSDILRVQQFFKKLTLNPDAKPIYIWIKKIIMKKYQFSQAGIYAMQADLYQLNDAALEAFAAELAKDFKRWAVNHLELTESQIRDLKSLNEQTINFLSFQGSFAMRNRRPIHLIKPVKMDGNDDGDKIIKPGGSIFAISDRKGNFSAEGTLTIEIAYEPLPLMADLIPEESFAEC